MANLVPSLQQAIMIHIVKMALLVDPPGLPSTAPS